MDIIEQTVTTEVKPISQMVLLETTAIGISRKLLYSTDGMNFVDQLTSLDKFCYGNVFGCLDRIQKYLKHDRFLGIIQSDVAAFYLSVREAAYAVRPIEEQTEGFVCTNKIIRIHYLYTLNKKLGKHFTNVQEPTFIACCEKFI